MNAGCCGSCRGHKGGRRSSLPGAGRGPEISQGIAEGSVKLLLRHGL